MGQRLKNIKRKERKLKQNFVFYHTFVCLTFCAVTFGQFKKEKHFLTHVGHMLTMEEVPPPEVKRHTLLSNIKTQLQRQQK